MWPGRWKGYFFPETAEQDECFCQEIFRLSEIGLRVVGGAEVAIALLMVLARVLSAGPVWLWEDAALGILGAGTILITRVQRLYEWSRLLSVASVLGAGMLMIWSVRADFVAALAALVMLVAVAAVPMRPMHALALGLAISIGFAARVGLQAADLLFGALLTTAGTGLTAFIYRQRHLAYQAYLQIVRACEELRDAQSRGFVSENASSMVRLAAALSHELNTPMGALLSSVKTLLSIAARQANAAPAEQAKLSRIQEDLQRSVEDSAQRLQLTVARMQRFTNLDKAEVQPANLNELLEDAAALLEPEVRSRAHLEFDFQPVPTMLCRRQQLSAVFSSLLTNAADAIKQQGRIVISTRAGDSQVEVQIRDDGCGVAPEQIRNIFDPGFKVVDGRVLTGNWRLFNSRQIIREHGGEIRIASEEGRGATVTVTLPVDERQKG